MDGTHIPISISRKDQGPWRNRKGFVSQNVLSACDHYMNFVYIYAGMEGSFHDSRVLREAMRKDNFKPPANCYFLADAGYSPNLDLVLVPYSGVTYHISRGQSRRQARNAQELDNANHASKRSVVERVFGVFKRRFRILREAREGFSVSTQINLVFALAAAHNFINKYAADDLNDFPDEGGTVVDAGDDSPDEDGDAPPQKQDRIANSMWESGGSAVENARRHAANTTRRRGN